MPDYTVGIGGSTTMMIRDTGGNVEFWIQTGSSTWNNDQQWSYRANGVDSPVLKFRMLRGGAWQKFGETYVTYDQDVRFTIYSAGLGFPTHDFIQHITRSTVPPPPTMKSVVATSATNIHVVFVGNGDGGSAILEWQIGYGGNPNAPVSLVGSGGTSDVGPFSSGERVYFWARGRNSIGWSAWSNRLDATTWKVPSAPQAVALSLATQRTVRTQFADNSNGGTAIVERQLGYGKDPVTPTSFAGDISGINSLAGLDPGKTYYFWARSRNSIGWGPWSVRTTTDLIAGARILDGVTWKRAVPYVRVGGVWKVARPWVRAAGVWKETSA